MKKLPIQGKNIEYEIIFPKNPPESPRKFEKNDLSSLLQKSENDVMIIY
jgi:hypothetical protein